MDHAALLVLAGEHSYHEQRSRAESLLEAALAEIDEDANPVRTAQLLERLARTQWSVAKGDEALATSRRALALLPLGLADAERAAVLAGSRARRGCAAATARRSLRPAKRSRVRAAAALERTWRARCSTPSGSRSRAAATGSGGDASCAQRSRSRRAAATHTRRPQPTEPLGHAAVQRPHARGAGVAREGLAASPRPAQLSSCGWSARSGDSVRCGRVAAGRAQPRRRGQRARGALARQPAPARGRARARRRRRRRPRTRWRDRAARRGHARAAVPRCFRPGLRGAPPPPRRARRCARSARGGARQDRAVQRGRAAHRLDRSCGCRARGRRCPARA